MSTKQEDQGLTSRRGFRYALLLAEDETSIVLKEKTFYTNPEQSTAVNSKIWNQNQRPEVRNIHGPFFLSTFAKHTPRKVGRRPREKKSSNTTFFFRDCDPSSFHLSQAFSASTFSPLRVVNIHPDHLR
jgi:hypothetical protein